MSEEVKQEATVPAAKPKQYLLLADELHMALLGKIMPGLLFVQVEGLNMQNNPDYMLLVNPVKKEVAPAPVPIEGIKSEEPKVD